MLDNIIMIF